MNWIQTRGIVLAITIITSALLLFGSSVNFNITSSTLLTTGIQYTWILGLAGIFVAYTFWNNYLGNGEWYYSKKSIITLLVISAIVLFGFAESFKIVINSPLIFGFKSAVILAIGQLYVIYLIWTRQI